MSRVTAYEIWSVDGLGTGIRHADLVAFTDVAADLLSYLRYSSKQTTRVFWDLDESIAPVLKTLPLPILERLAAFDENLSYHGHELYYLPG